MAKTALTKMARDHVTAGLTRKAKEAFLAWERPAAKALAEAVVADIVREEFMTIYRSLPKGWLPERCQITIRLDSGYARLYWEDPIPVPDSVSYACNAGELSKPLQEKLEAFETERRQRQEQLNKLTDTLKTALGSVRSVDALKEQWPEAYEFLPPESRLGMPAGSLTVPLASAKWIYEKLLAERSEAVG
jgi:Nucleotide modification associated domain 5